MYQEEKRSWLKHLDFTVLDLLLMELAYYVAYLWRFDTEAPLGEIDYRIIGVVAALVDICVVFFGESYSGVLRRNRYRELRHTVIHCSIVFAGVVVYMYATQLSFYVSRRMLFVFWILSIGFSYVGRVFLKRYVRWNLIKNRKKTHMIIVSSYEYMSSCIAQIAANIYTEFVVDGLVVIDRDLCGQELEGIPVVATADNFMEYLRTNVVDQVYINGHTKESASALAQELVEYGVTVHVALMDVSKLAAEQRVERMGSSLVLTASLHIANSRQLFFKRIMDILGGLVGISCTAVIFVIFAPIIKVQSPGPIFYTQTRIGKNGRRFKLYKFRSMYVDADQRKAELMAQNEMQGNMFKLEDDPRITPIGRFMRKYSLDEFPQFWNVLKGDMSLVGTRPPVEEEYERYMLHHKARLGIKPGLTGMWQVSGRNDITDFEEVVALDTAYIADWTIGMDLMILAKTVVVVLTAKGSK